ncbi:radical SAM protein [Amycolatopsis sp.]|uniref:radical SAM protein n=1 Tax=Amycolatopsis sp. TaxID=37632 RepID=UPI002D7E7B34|nr:radical SAM protein [Amycolatopsis sp.]HET6711254.1 radical SAM protein [Amycolatopsis sp.]
MTLPSLKELFAAPGEARADLIRRTRWRPGPLPDRGSSFFIHLSELCPVACKHCMYSSDLERKSEKDSLSPAELEDAIAFIDETGSEKLNITGGGEPFLKLPSILRLLETVRVPRIELVTAGYWAKTQAAADRMLDRLVGALAKNPRKPELMLRLSLDRYHLNAPYPVLIEHYGNIARAWDRGGHDMLLGFRGIQPDLGHVDRLLAEEVGGELTEVDAWNLRLKLPGGRSAPLTFNVFRLSGKAGELVEGAELSTHSKTIREYYGPFEKRQGQLVLATAVNDAIRGSYTDTGGLAITMNSDGSFWIFCGTAPDRRLMLGETDFAGAIEHFFADPVTRLLVDDGVWALADVVAELDPLCCTAAVAKNDVASLVEDLLADPAVRLAVTLVALHRLLGEDRLSVDGLPPGHEILLPEADLVRSCRGAIAGEGA